MAYNNLLLLIIYVASVAKHIVNKNYAHETQNSDVVYIQDACATYLELYVDRKQQSAK